MRSILGLDRQVSSKACSSCGWSFGAHMVASRKGYWALPTGKCKMFMDGRFAIRVKRG